MYLCPAQPTRYARPSTDPAGSSCKPHTRRSSSFHQNRSLPHIWMLTLPSCLWKGFVLYSFCNVLSHRYKPPTARFSSPLSLRRRSRAATRALSSAYGAGPRSVSVVPSGIRGAAPAFASGAAFTTTVSIVLAATRRELSDGSCML